MPTYTSPLIQVSNGDVTSHHPQQLVPITEPVVVTNPEIQWEGIREQNPITDRSFVENAAPITQVIEQDGGIFNPQGGSDSNRIYELTLAENGNSKYSFKYYNSIGSGNPGYPNSATATRVDKIELSRIKNGTVTHQSSVFQPQTPNQGQFVNNDIVRTTLRFTNITNQNVSVEAEFPEGAVLSTSITGNVGLQPGGSTFIDVFGITISLQTDTYRDHLHYKDARSVTDQR
jgi:hypothetical protein